MVGVDLPEPQGQQREVVYLAAQGHTVVLGTAGSGKTTMAVHRARYLAGAPGIGGPTLLLTFNKALVTYLKSIGARAPHLTVENYHKFALGYLSSVTGGPVWVCKTKETLVEKALTEVRATTQRAVAARPLDFFLDELHWMAGHGVTGQATYLNGVQRIGRGTSLAPADRAVVYQVYRRYLELRAAAGLNLDWDDAASQVLEHLRTDTRPRLYRHIVIDEGQDFTPEMIRSLAAAIPTNGSLTFFGDYAQQIYGSRMSWRSLGLSVSGKIEFEQNYRNSRQIARLAHAMSEMPHFRDEVDLVAPRAPTADGPLPTLVTVASKADQLRQAASYANGLAADRRVAVLMRTRAQEAVLRQHLDPRHRHYRIHRELPSWPKGPGVFYGTYSAAKGLEFDSVILPLCDVDELPKPTEVAAHGLEEALAREARQLYVAVTRARSELVILRSGPLTPLLPDAMSDLFYSLPT
ncbi:MULTISPECIES: 3'-5' exonuclease [unclassified Streptomyces]|uniref:3'-5' exonuclease n=1 Tax=unclassified Streptomyces TaxID=2593676 RepID=UPI00081E99F4|nr:MULTISPECIES: 3'-5' exonuclease [unclassified Streptomyces]MYZ34888.1 AAA family ATPase [Streptomyces sp. SID4917]SCF71131.1 UvrD/REP helicase N-terminal domain-containing protein [Streptomyces sp. MnatMP-M17]